MPRVTREHLTSAVFVTAGERGLTDDELDDLAKGTSPTLRPRRVTLWQKGLLTPTGRMRRTRYGKLAQVWVWSGEPWK